ncbi:hypothetical protein [Alienimonas sp. DA493]
MVVLALAAAGCGGVPEGELESGPAFETSPEGGRITTPGAAPEEPRGVGE